MPAVITITNTMERRQKNIYAFTVNDMKMKIIEYVKTKWSDSDKKEDLIDVSQFKKLVLSKEFINKIICLTQQYFFEKEVKFQSKISLQIETKIGKDVLIENGNSKIVSAPILNVSEWKGIKRGTVGQNDFLFARDLNNFSVGFKFLIQMNIFSVLMYQKELIVRSRILSM